MRGAIPPLLQYTFMARCSVKAQGQLYLYLTCTLTDTNGVLSEKNSQFPFHSLLLFFVFLAFLVSFFLSVYTVLISARIWS